MPRSPTNPPTSLDEIQNVMAPLTISDLGAYGDLVWSQYLDVALVAPYARFVPGIAPRLRRQIEYYTKLD